MLSAVLLLLPGLLLGWTLGGNDAANVFGPAVATGRVRFRTIALVAALFVVLGAGLQGGGGVATYESLAIVTPWTAAALSLASALAVSIFLWRGFPISVTQTVAGALIGVSLVRHGLGGVDSGTLVRLLIAWTLVPPGAALLAYALYRLARRYLQPRLLDLRSYDQLIAGGFIVFGAYGAYALGANNAANVAGAYVDAGVVGPELGALLGGVGIAIGMFTGSHRVIDTVGRRITQLTSFAGLMVLIAEALMLHLYSIIGVPISASQTIVGGVIGVGAVKGAQTINQRLVTKLALSWFGGPLIGAALAALFVMGLR
ncbi:MAG: anion permease [Candidatus Bipolaricaulia bacterium]